MNITLFSRHIPKDSFDGSNIIMHDLRVFGDAMHSAFALSQKDKNFGKTRKEQNLPDRRTMEGRKSKSNEQPSVFIQVKEKYGFSTYFANSVLQESSAILRSVKELHADNVKGVKDKLSQVEKKLKKSAKRLKELEKTKKCLINISKGNKHTKLRMPKGSVETYDKEKGCFYIWKYNPKTSIRILTKTYSDSYQFETQYLTPKIKNAETSYQ